MFDGGNFMCEYMLEWILHVLLHIDTYTHNRSGKMCSSSLLCVLRLCVCNRLYALLSLW